MMSNELILDDSSLFNEDQILKLDLGIPDFEHQFSEDTSNWSPNEFVQDSSGSESGSPPRIENEPTCQYPFIEQSLFNTQTLIPQQFIMNPSFPMYNINPTIHSGLNTFNNPNNLNVQIQMPTTETEKKANTKPKRRTKKKTKEEKEQEIKQSWKRKREERERELQQFLTQTPIFKSKEEEREWKKQKRIIRNRLSAQKSRERRKEQIERLEEENKQLKQKNAELACKVQQLASENIKLKERLREYETNLFLNDDTQKREEKSFGESISSLSKSLSQGKKAVALTFVFIFTIGLFININIGNTEKRTLPVISKEYSTGRHPGRVLLSTSTPFELPSSQQVLNLPYTQNSEMISIQDMKRQPVYLPAPVQHYLFKQTVSENNTNHEISLGHSYNVKDLPDLDSPEMREWAKSYLLSRQDDSKEVNKGGTQFICPVIYPLFSQKNMGNNGRVSFLVPVQTMKNKTSSDTIVKFLRFESEFVSVSEAFMVKEIKTIV